MGRGHGGRRSAEERHSEQERDDAQDIRTRIPAHSVTYSGGEGRFGRRWRAAYSALSPCSSVRMRITSSRSVTKILPSPNFPVLADDRNAFTTSSTSAPGTATSTLSFGRNSTLYSVPRYVSDWPFCRPNPFTSVTVMPTTPASCSAVLTDSRRWGRMMPSTFFIGPPLGNSIARPPGGATPDRGRPKQSPYHARDGRERPAQAS